LNTRCEAVIDSLARNLKRPPKGGPHKVQADSEAGEELADDAAAEADGNGVGAAPRLELREDVADVRLHRFLGQKQALADLAVHEAVRNQLQNLDLPHRRLLFQLAERALERDDLGRGAAAAPRRNRLETAGMAGVAVENLFALSCVHDRCIGAAPNPL
jgi:hypothetical protein